MPKRIDWLPYGMMERKSFLNVFATSIVQYGAALGLSSSEINRIQEIAAAYSYAVDQAGFAKIFSKSLTAWRNSVISGKRPRKPLSPVPVFISLPAPVGTSTSLILEIRKIVGRIKTSSGYNIGIGTGLNILSPNHVKKPLGELKPIPKVTAVDGYRVRIACEMQGMDALRVEYRRKGEETWTVVAFLTSLPETFYIQPAVMGVPEGGQMRAIFLKKNKIVGQYSNMPSVTLFAS